MSQTTKKVSWWIMTFLAVSVGAYAVAIALVPQFRVSFAERIFENFPIAGPAHFLGAGIALLTGPFQFNAKIRSRYLNFHRTLGKVYVISILVGGSASLQLALASFGGLVTHWGFGLLGVAWLGSTIYAFVAIRHGNVSKHQDWMLRSFALTYAAVTLRIYLPLSQISGIPFETAYQIISWLCWVPNLLVIEWVLWSQKQVASPTLNSNA